MRWIVVQTDFHEPLSRSRQVSAQPFELVLPYPSEALLRVACEMAGCLSDSDYAAMNRILHQRIGENPTLLLVALAGFHTEHHMAPESVEVLIDYCVDHLTELLAKSTACSESTLVFSECQPAVEKRLRQFTKANCNKKLRKSLVRFASCFSSDTDRTKTIVSNLVGNAFRGDQFELCENEDVDQEVCWESSALDALCFQNLFGSLASNQQTAVQFQVELQQAKLISMKGLAYGASHEINNPLANISTRAQTLLRDETDSEKRHKLSVIYEQAMRAHEMISDMMLFAHPPGVEFERTDLRDAAKQVVREMKSELELSQVEVLVRQYPDVVPVQVDQTQFAVALKAIIRNSVEAIGRVGEVRIRFFRESEHIVGISIIDDGPGVPSEIADNLFDPFFSGREAGRGLGFGLSKAWRIMDLHSGSIFFDPTHQGGAKFEIRLPVSQPEVATIPMSRVA